MVHRISQNLRTGNATHPRFWGHSSLASAFLAPINRTDRFRNVGVSPQAAQKKQDKANARQREKGYCGPSRHELEVEILAHALKQQAISHR
jgi:hypothetical protein